MPKFTYRAKQGPGQVIAGTVEADTLDSAVRQVTQMGYFPLDVIEAGESSKSNFVQAPKPVWIFRRKITVNQVAIFTRQIFVLVDSGVPILKTLKTILNQTISPAFKKIVQDLYTFIEDGGTLSDGLALHPDVFSKLYVNMVKAGELSGQLPRILNRLADFIEREERSRTQIKTSLYYPIFVAVVGVAAVFIIMTFVIPKLSGMFEESNTQLPLPTRILMGISDICVHFWWLGLILVGAGLLSFRQFNSSIQGKKKIDGIKLRIPVLSNLIREIELARFARTLGTLIQSGVVIVTALEAVVEVLDNEVLRENVREAAREVKNGASLTNALAKSSYFPEAALSIIAVGEESGHLDKGLHNLADSYERQSETTLKTIISLFGPSMILIIGLIVAFIVIAMALPILQMNLLVQ